MHEAGGGWLVHSFNFLLWSLFLSGCATSNVSTKNCSYHFYLPSKAAELQYVHLCIRETAAGRFPLRNRPATHGEEISLVTNPCCVFHDSRGFFVFITCFVLCGGARSLARRGMRENPICRDTKAEILW